MLLLLCLTRPCSALAFNDEYNEALHHSLVAYDGSEAVDVVLRRSYPHPLSPWPGEDFGTALLLFYTSEQGAALPASSFSLGAGGASPSAQQLRARLAHPRLHALTPSEWSARGARTHGAAARVLPHGVDARLFHRLPPARRAATRASYGVLDTDFLLLSVGAMTRNKGLIPLLRALHALGAEGEGDGRRVRLLLKGVGELYDSRRWVESFFGDVLRLDPPPGPAAAFESSLSRMFADILYIDNTLPAAGLCELYNAADLYAAPYLAEGFSLTPLEALRAGLPVLAPRGGGAAEYLAALSAGDGAQFVLFLDAPEVTRDGGAQLLDVRWADVVRAVREAMAAKQRRGSGDTRPPRAAAERLAAHIDADWSWRAVAERLMALFEEVSWQPKDEL